MYKNLLLIACGCLTLLGLFFLTFSGGSGAARGRADFAWNNATEPQTLDPGLMSGQPEGAIAIALFEGLTTYHPASLKPLPGVATRWEIDGLTYRFHLRPDAWWVRGDGVHVVDGRRRNVVAADLIYAWRRQLHPETGAEYSYLFHHIAGVEQYETSVAEHWNGLVTRLNATHPDVILIEPRVLRDAGIPELAEEYRKVVAFRDTAWQRLVEIRAPSDLALEVTLKSPAPYFLDLTSFYPFMAVPREVIEEHGRKWVLPEHIVSNGPYILHDWRFNASVRLRKNPHYWENASYAERRLAELGARAESELAEPARLELDYLRRSGAFVERGLETIDALAVEELNTGLNLYINGDVDRLREMPAEVVGDLTLEDRKPDVELRHLRQGPMNGAYYYCVNMELPVFQSDPRDEPRVELGRKLRRALALAIDRAGVIDLVYRAPHTQAFRLVPNRISEDYSDRPLFGSGDHDTDVARAKQLIAEVRAAGLKVPKLKILYNTREDHAKAAAFVQGLWKQHLDIDVDLTNQEWGVYLDSRRTGSFEIARFAWIGDYPDPNTFLDMFTVGNPNNDPRYANPHYDRIVKVYCADILERLATAESRNAILDDIATWRRYEETVKKRRRGDGRNLDETLRTAMAAYAGAPRAQQLARAFEIRLLLFEVAEEMIIYDMPAIPIFFYSRTQLWPPELEGMHMNSRDVHPLKTLRWKGGERPKGKRYRDFPRLEVELPVSAE